MSKRTRGARRVTQRRPGARPGTPRRGPAATGTTAVTSATRSEAIPLTPADTLGRPLETITPEPRTVTPSAHPRARAKPGSLLAARAANEYVYVSRDLRKILLVASVLFAILVGLWVVLVLMGLSPLY